MIDPLPLPNPLPLSRRRFLRTTGVGVLGLSAFGCDTSGVSSTARGRPVLTRPNGPDDDAWAHVRDQFILEPGVAYMNNASVGMPPAAVVESVAAGYEAISREPLHGKHDL